MKGNEQFDVFLSYSHSDADFVRDWLYPHLVEKGLNVCIDIHRFELAETLVNEITAAITRSAYTVLVFTPSYLSSHWAQFERELSSHLTASGKNRAVPLLLQACEIPNPFEMYVRMDFTREKDREHQLRKLVAKLKGQTAPEIDDEPAPVVRSHYRNFDVDLSPSGRRSYVLRASCPHVNGAATEVIAIDTAELLVRSVKIKSGGADRVTCSDMGRVLYRTIFTPGVIKLWNVAQEAANGGDGRGVLRLRLRFGEPALSELPWELLHDEGSFLAMAVQRPVVRYAADVAAEMARRANVLVIDTTGSSAAGDEPIAAAMALVRKGRGELRTLRDAALPEIQEALREAKYDVVHLIGRAASADGVGRLLLRKGTSKSELPVDGEMFGILLRNSPVRLLVLEVIDDGGAGLSVAEGVSRAGIPAIVATQGNVLPEAARAFSGAFYRVLMDGCPVEACVAEGRKAIMNVVGLDNPQWAFPVLFDNARDVMLFRAAPAEYCFGIESASAVAPSASAASTTTSVARPTAAPAHNLGEGAEQTVVGRDAELAALRAALAPEALNKIVLLSGDAGMGKTTIAAAAARDALANAMFDTIVWISPQDPEVTQINDPEHCAFGQISLKGMTELVLHTIGQSQLLGLDTATAIREMAALLAYGRHLIVIDDLPPASHAAAKAFIESMPRTVRFIVTSSQRIGIGEHEISLGPTSALVPFIENAERQRRKHVKSTLPAVPSMPAEYLRVVLPTLPAHWLTLLAVCATLPFRAGESIVHTASELDKRKFASALSALEEMRLVHREQGTFIVLSGALRSFFRDGHEEVRAELPDVENACVAAYVAFLRQKHKGPAADRIEPHLGNIVWAVQRAYANGSFHDLKIFRTALDDPLYRIPRFCLSLGIGDLAYLAASRIADYQEMAWAAVYPLGRMHYHSGNFGLAERWCATALAMFEQQKNDNGVVAAQRYLGRIKQSQGELGEARTYFVDALRRTSQLQKKNPEQLGLAYASLAGLAHAEGKYNEAEMLYGKALELYKEAKQPDSVGATLHAIGRLYVASDPATALRYFDDAQKMLEGMRWTTRNASIAFAVGLAYENQRRFDDALEQFRRARQIFAENGAGNELTSVDAALVRITALREHEERSTN